MNKKTKEFINNIDENLYYNIEGSTLSVKGSKLKELYKKKLAQENANKRYLKLDKTNN